MGTGKKGTAQAQGAPWQQMLYVWGSEPTASSAFKEPPQREVAYAWTQQQTSHRSDGRCSDGSGQPYQDQHVHRCECNRSPAGHRGDQNEFKGLQM
ncbi:hypothetical protein PoB_001921000 [Plakobranchus ocellatus]|uniref:Uncharacterized protein n=1 Tax=Plakobranchus ocellatus TaxID=259542 RepID=A0AAV3ZAZ3_9GAST|nr:hypothetical protein PoB_001921000 [Plakobranchus ocellatus]